MSRGRPLPALRLRPGREKSLLRRHPWVFSGALAERPADLAIGETVQLLSSDGRFLAQAAYSPHSQICARVWCFDADRAPVDEGFFAERIGAAMARRERDLGPQAAGSARRLVNAEADGLPGVIVDLYGGTAVLCCLSAGAERWRDTIANQLMNCAGVSAVLERSEAEVRQLEGLPARSGPLRGEVPAQTLVHETLEGAGPIVLEVDLQHGHKTGLYLDQVGNRRILARQATGRRVLNCFAYTGAFGCACLAGDAAQVLSIESAAEAVALGRKNEARNGFGPERADWIVGDVFAQLRRLRDARERFDLIVLDPPKFAPTQGHVERAARAYKDINLLAFKLLGPGGLLASFSCSAAVDAALFRRIVAGAAEDAAADVIVRQSLGAAPDHPVRLSFPEGDYLKGLLLEKL